jgi:hypothetical protein
MKTRNMDMLNLTILDVSVGIRCAEKETRALLTAHYGWMQGPLDGLDVQYTVTRPGRSLLLARDGVPTSAAADPGALLLLLDQDLIVQLQKRRPDLYFVHAGVLESAGQAFMLVAPSGGGKSTTAWGLVHHGFRYMSDELGPVDLRTLMVHPYPRSLSLKGMPPRAYPLPRRAVASSRGFHITTAAISSGIHGTAAALTATFFLRYVRDAPRPSVRRISAAHAGARLYANALNALAHPEDGLDAAIRIARATACFELGAADMAATCALVEATLATLPTG